MHRRYPLVVFCGLLSVASFCPRLSHAQTVMLDLPRQSQHALITQRIGITDITVNYHRPAGQWPANMGQGRTLRAGLAGRG